MDHKSFLSSFYRIIKDEKEAIKQILLSTILFNLCLFSIPIIIQILINQVTLHIYQESTVAIFVFLAIACFACFYFKTYRLNLIELLQRRLHVNASEHYSQLFINWYPEAFEKVRSQQAFHKFFEIFVFQKSFVRVIKEGFQLTIQLLIGFIIISFYHVSFFAYSIILTTIYYFIIRSQWKNILQKNLELSDKKYQSISWLEQQSLNRDTFLSQDASQFALEKSFDMTKTYIEKRSEFFDLFIKQIKQILSMQFLASFILFLIGTILVYRKQLNLGQFIAAEIIITSIMLSFGKVTELLEDLYDSIISSYKLFAASEDLQKIAKSGKEVHSHEHSWQINQVKLPSGIVISASFEKHKKIALYAKEGAGKTVLVNYMLRYKENYDGLILLNNIDIKELSSKSFYSHVAVVRDEPQFFSGSIWDNLLLGNSKITEVQVLQVLEQVGVYPYIKKLPQQLQTPLALNGFPLSETYAKLLLVARAFLLNPGTVIIDGVLDSMDHVMIDKLVSFIKFQNQTVLIMTSRKSIADKLDESMSLE
jgi:ABC-type bacteriocin/lantibiotic exporter with double-glycine peptidase domain